MTINKYPAAERQRPLAFEAWKEGWLRSIIADSNLWNCDKAVAGFLSFHLNRETRSCFPSYATIGKGLGIDRLNARRSIKRLIAYGYLVRARRGRGQSNLYFPAEGVVVHDHLTSEVEPLKEPLRAHPRSFDS
jgi:Helix-turn-helix domain